MNERITFISVLESDSIAKIENYTKSLNAKLCKVPYSKNVVNREEVDTLPYHFTLSAWSIKDKEFITKELSKITFPKLHILIDDVKIMNGKEESYVLYFNIKENEELKRIHQKVYQILPSEKYNPKTFSFHITIHIDKDYNKIMEFKESILKNFIPFEIEVNSFGLYEIYPAKKIKHYN